MNRHPHEPECELSFEQPRYGIFQNVNVSGRRRYTRRYRLSAWSYAKARTKDETVISAPGQFCDTAVVSELHPDSRERNDGRDTALCPVVVQPDSQLKPHLQPVLEDPVIDKRALNIGTTDRCHDHRCRLQ
jgi:hypothetical protein